MDDGSKVFFLSCRKTAFEQQEQNKFLCLLLDDPGVESR